MKVGDLVKYHAAARAPKIITVLGFLHDKTNATVRWVKGLEIDSTTQRLYEPEHCEVISASR